MQSENLEIFGDRIRGLRKGLGLSQEKLAERADLHRNFVGFIERGERNSGLLTIIKLAFALNMTPAELLQECKFKIHPDQ